ncbi:hypothetical protein ACU5AX_13210 [Sphingomonas sp. XXL09]|uniref:hypothetical protein n=1 Tax=Sphingomonas sp. XXL09 TaxID=3457787 RepID=UPI00406BB7D2
MAKATVSVRHVDPPSSPAWKGPAHFAVISALHLPMRTELRDVTGTQPTRQVLCGQARTGSDQPFRRFTYVKTAKLGAIDDGGADFAEAYAQLCGH